MGNALASEDGIVDNINPLYKQEASSVRELLQEEHAVLGQILTPEVYQAIKSQLVEAPTEKHFQADAFSYESTAVSLQLETAMKSIAAFLSEITQSTFTAKSISAKKFQKGNFFLQHAYTPFDGWQLYLFLPLAPWQDGFRGELVVTKEQPLILSPQENTLFLVKTNLEQRAFIKRLTHHTDTAFWLVSAKLVQ